MVTEAITAVASVKLAGLFKRRFMTSFGVYLGFLSDLKSTFEPNLYKACTHTLRCEGASYPTPPRDLVACLLCAQTLCREKVQRP